ncbi:FtsB family cell division protein [Occallatibacter riparius]|uniref:Septum formation initiator family protein n=1 Tax=Occallatibacter riparius TaxID=1002689 RepID=A0A9J7BSH9_9BACT|nr:septum formation initiator family protein [Occallatibacter riparius]UWZ83989.1 septum formation initiator family protein [Occallatibacter riparius]
MQDQSTVEMFAPEPVQKPPVQAQPLSHRVVRWATNGWRSAASAVAVGLALLLGWHVVNGKHGLSFWEQKRVEDKQLQKEIDQLQQENSRLRVRVDKLKTDPDEIEHEAREKLRYARQGEVIVDLSNEVKPAAASPSK